MNRYRVYGVGGERIKKSMSTKSPYRSDNEKS
jgi:hypothetical protein